MSTFTVSRLDYVVALSLSAFAFAGAGTSECYEAISADGAPDFSLQTFADRLEFASRASHANPRVSIEIAA